MLLRLSTTLGALSLTLLGGCATPMYGPSASAELLARSGSAVNGMVNFSEKDGRLRIEAKVAGLTLSGETGVVGRSVVIHADPDDYKSQPAGNSGKRIACGVIAAR